MVGGFLGDLCSPLIFVAIVVLLVILLRRTNRLNERLSALEGRWRRLAASDSEEHKPRPHPPAHTAPLVPRADMPAGPTAEEPSTTRPRPRPRLRPRPEPQPSGERFNLEGWLGSKALGWLAVLLLLFATAFFLKYAFDNQWIGPTGQVGIGLVAGSSLAYAGFRVHRRGGWLFGQMLTAAGIVLLYLSTWATFGYFRLVPQEWGFVFLVVIVVECAALAVLYEAPSVGLMAVIGGLLTPLLMHVETDQYVTLFVYLLVLDAGVVVIGMLRPWPALCTVALLGSQAIFAAWASEHYHPEKRPWALGFQCGLFVLFEGQILLTYAWRRRLIDAEGLARVPLLATLFAASVFALLWTDYRVWMGTLAVGHAIVYAMMAWYVLVRNPDSSLLILTLVAVTMGFISLAIPLQAWLGPTEVKRWISVGWAAQGLALWWFGLRVRNDPLRVMGFVLLALAIMRLIVADTPYTARELFVPFFNSYALSALAVTACALGAALASRHYLGMGDGINRVVQAGFGIVGILLLLFIVSNELYDFFFLHFGGPAAPRARLAAHTALSAVWAVYALAVLVIGLRLHSEPLRWTALGLFGLAFLKVLVHDTAELSGLYRVAVFFALAVMMGAAAWGYQKFLRPLAD